MATTGELVRELETGAYDETLKRLYGGEKATFARQRKRYVEAVRRFEEYFGAGRQVRLYSSPGRTEICGNHTDHQNGLCLAAAVNLDLIAVVAPADTNIVRVKSYGFNKLDVICLDDFLPQQNESVHSAALIRGIAADICRLGGSLGGFDAYTTSDVLRGSGLSSSAAFESAIAEIFNQEYNAGAFSTLELAQLCLHSENQFFGKPTGMLDQLAVCTGGIIRVDFENHERPEIKKVQCNLVKNGLALCVTDTRASHSELTAEFSAIRTEMEQVAAFFGKKVLRDVPHHRVLEQVSKIRRRCGDRALLRALHFYAECARAAAECDALEADNMQTFLRLVRESGHSACEYNQNAFNPKTPGEQGLTVGLALSREVLGESGAFRLQGSGFAGTIQAFVPLEYLEAYRSTMESAFGKGCCYVLNFRSVGCCEVTRDLCETRT